MSPNVRNYTARCSPSSDCKIPVLTSTRLKFAALTGTRRRNAAAESEWHCSRRPNSTTATAGSSTRTWPTLSRPRHRRHHRARRDIPSRRGHPRRPTGGQGTRRTRLRRRPRRHCQRGVQRQRSLRHRPTDHPGQVALIVRRASGKRGTGVEAAEASWRAASFCGVILARREVRTVADLGALIHELRARMRTEKALGGPVITWTTSHWFLP